MFVQDVKFCKYSGWLLSCGCLLIGVLVGNVWLMRKGRWLGKVSLLAGVMNGVSGCVFRHVAVYNLLVSCQAIFNLDQWFTLGKMTLAPVCDLVRGFCGVVGWGVSTPGFIFYHQTMTVPLILKLLGCSFS